MDGSRSDKPPEDDLHGRKLVERVVRDTIKRVVETGVEKIAEGPENLRNFVADLKLPKEIASYLLLQIDETKSGLYRVVAKELQGFLQQNDLGEALAKAFSHLSVEIKTEIRFVPTAGESGGDKLGQPEVRSSVQVKSDRPPRFQGQSKLSARCRRHRQNRKACRHARLDVRLNDQTSDQAELRSRRVVYQVQDGPACIGSSPFMTARSSGWSVAPAGGTTTSGRRRPPWPSAAPPPPSPAEQDDAKAPEPAFGAQGGGIAETERQREETWQKAVLGQPISSFKAYRASQTFGTGDLIRHGKFGDGYIVRVIDRQKVEVMFKDGPRTLAQALDA